MDFLYSIFDAVIHFPTDTLSAWSSWTSGEKIGFVASGFSNIAYAPQFYRIWTTRSARDVSFGMYAFLMAGAGIWLVYGLLTSQRPIVVNNCITLGLRASVLLLKLFTDKFRSKKAPHQKSVSSKERRVA